MTNHIIYDELSDHELLRYSRQIMLPKFDIAGQLALKNASVLILGLGGLGSPAALYLAAAGVGKLVLVDDDEVDLSNLQRQIVHTEKMLGQAKVESAASQLRQINPHIDYEIIAQRLEADELKNLIESVDLVLDCSDNFATRFEVNRYSVETLTPLVSAAAIRMEGQISVFDPRQATSPCYQCLYPEGSEQAMTCSESGVMSPLVGILGSMQAMEAIKVLSGLGESLVGRLLILDAMTMQWRSLKLKKDPQCSCCGKQQNENK
jgi:molybdopterin/thiamine biosynthesis adenylyltransferase